MFDSPSGYASHRQHFAIPGPRDGPDQLGSNVPIPAHADVGLVIGGNVIRNRVGLSRRIEGDVAGRRADYPTCNEEQLRQESLFEDVE